jgi:hydroxymethylbilane synthase
MATQTIDPPTGSVPEKTHFKIGTRSSKLALVQANYCLDLLSKAFPELSFETSTTMVQGDTDKNASFQQLSQRIAVEKSADAAKSLWTKEIEDRLTAGEVDVIVHSLKDMPTMLPEGCILGAIPEREDPTDALVMKSGSPYKTLDELPVGSVVGTSSIRRTAMLKHIYPHLTTMECRGNM